MGLRPAMIAGLLAAVAGMSALAASVAAAPALAAAPAPTAAPALVAAAPGPTASPALSAAPAAVAPRTPATLLAKATSAGPAHKAATQKPAKAPPPGPPRIVDLDWKELLPEGERTHFISVAPPPVHDYRGEGGPPAVQAQDFNVNKSLDGATVRLPGFIVPLEAVKTDGVSEFLLVPYFGSCIHVPPPPPNQIVYVHTSKPKDIDSIYDAYWITGKLHLQTKSTRLGSTAYELSADKIEVYKY